MGLSFQENIEQYMSYLGHDDGSKYLKEINDENIEAIKNNGAKIYDGVIDTIKKLSKIYKLGIVTNNTSEYVESFFKTSNLEKYFIDYIGATSYNVSKGEAIKMMVKRNQTVDNYYVGDIKNDMLFSFYAKVDFIHARYGFGQNFKTKYYIERITDLPDLMNKIKEEKRI